MFSNNKTHVFKCIYQIPPHIFNLIFKVATKQQKKKKEKKKKDDVLENIYGKMTHFPKYVNVKTKKE